MDLKELKESYTEVDPNHYRWYVGVYNVYLENNVTYITQLDKHIIFSIFRKLRYEHTINWSRNYLYEFDKRKIDDVRRLLLKIIHRTNRFDVLKVCLYLLRSIRRHCVLDDYVIRKIPEIKQFLDNYVEPNVTDLQKKIMYLSKSEHSLKDLEEILITNRDFKKIMDYRMKNDIHRYHLTKLNSIEIELTTNCNLKCFNCDRMCGKAQSTESMTVQQIKKFIEESKTDGRIWERIALTGGEPTLHPDIIEIVGLMLEYRNSYLPKSSYIQVVSNGYGQSSEVLNRIRAMYTQDVVPSNESNTFIRNNNKRNKVVLHSPINMAPIDDDTLKNSEFRNGCWVTETCGLSLTRYGYYCCGAGSGIDRVFGYDIGIKSLKEVCMNRIIEQRKKLCRLCGRFNDIPSSSKVYYGPNWVIEEKESVTWKKAFELYKKHKPILTLY